MNRKEKRYLTGLAKREKGNIKKKTKGAFGKVKPHNFYKDLKVIPRSKRKDNI